MSDIPLFDPDYVSRTRQFVEQRSQERLSEHRIARLQAQLEEEERRNLRLSSQLLDEVALRARAERARDELGVSYRTLQAQLMELESKPNDNTRSSKGTGKGRKRAGNGGKVSERVQRTDGSPSPKPKSDGIPADLSSDASSTGPSASPRKNSGDSKSSRVRGSVK